MDDLEDLITRFCHRQLDQMLEEGTGIGLSPLTACATLLQLCAASLASVARAEAVALLRAYADCIEAGPGPRPAKDDARRAFEAAAQAYATAAKVARAFPTPQGRA